MTVPLVHTAYVSLGSNEGDSATLLAEARRELAAIPDTTLEAVSSVYHTQPQDDPGQPWFWNQVARLRTALSPLALLAALQAIEERLGRTRLAERRFGPRTMDLDLLVFGAVTLHTEALTVPHPRLTERAFVLVPLVELDRRLTLPGGTGVHEALSRLSYTCIGRRIWQPAKEYP